MTERYYEENKLITDLKDYTSVVLYGAGNVARTVLEHLKSKHPEIHVVAMAVTAYDSNPYNIYDIPVVQIDELVIDRENDVVLVATLERTQEEIVALLNDYEIKNIACICDSLYEEWKRKIPCLKEDNLMDRYIMPYLDYYNKVCHEIGMPDMEARKNIPNVIDMVKSDNLNIMRLVVVLGTKCSLRCRDCNNLMPYFKPQVDLDEQDIISGLQAITEKTQTILICELIGGEPFLAGNFAGVLRYVTGNPVIKYVEITTNGTIMPNEEQIALMRHPKVLVRISDYGSIVNKDRIIQILEDCGIRHKILYFSNWVSPGGTECRNRTKEELKKYYKRCMASYDCKTLYDGKIFSCARAASLHALGFMKENEYIDIRKEVTVQEMKQFLLQDYSVACDYCDVSIDNRILVEPAIQL